MISIETEGNRIYTTASEKLTSEDYDKLIPELERLLDEHPKINWYFEMRDYNGWKPSAFCRDIRFDIAHANDFEKIAMVGDEAWEKWITEIMKPFTEATVRYYDLVDKEEARDWIA